MPDPKNKKTKDTLYTWNGRQVNKRFSDSISFQKNYANKIYEEGKKDFDFDKIKRGMKLMPGPGTLKKKFQGGEQTTTYNMSAYKMEEKKKKIKTVPKNKSKVIKAKSNYDAKVKKQMEDYQNKKFEAEFAAKAKMTEKKMYGGKQYVIMPPSSSSRSFGPPTKSKPFNMSPKGHGGQGYAMMGSKPKTKGKMVKIKGAGERRVVGGSGFIGYLGPGGIAKGLKSLAGTISKIKNPHTAKFAGKLLNFSKKLKPKEHVGPKFGSYSSKRGQRRPDGTRY